MNSPEALSSAGVLRAGVLANLAGLGLPLVAAVAAIPRLVSVLGTTGFGVLALAGLLIGYSSLLDLGLSRALTHSLAHRLGRGRGQVDAGEVWTANALMLGLGILGGVVLAGAGGWLATSAFRVPVPLQPDTALSFRILAPAIPILLVTAGFKAVLEAHQRFPLSNAIRLPLGLSTYLGPLAVTAFSNRLPAMMAVLLAARLAGLAAYAIAAWHVVPGLRRPVLAPAVLPRLLAMGGWLTAANAALSLILYADRLVIAGLSVALVSYYVTPSEVVVKLMVIASALAGVVFPAFATTVAADRERTARIFATSLRLLLMCFVPVGVLLILFGRLALGLWLGPAFASNSTPVLEWLAAGLLAAALAQIPTALLQGIGRPRATALLTAAELPFFLAALLVVLPRYGISGVAAVWTLRAVFDLGALLWLAGRALPVAAGAARRVAGQAAVALGVLGLAAVAAQSSAGQLLGTALLLASLAVAWLRLPPAERALLGFAWAK